MGWDGMGWDCKYLHCLGIWMEKSIDVVSEPVVSAPLTGISFFIFIFGRFRHLDKLLSDFQVVGGGLA